MSDSQARQDPRLEELLALALELGVGNYDIPYEPTDADDTIEALRSAFRMIGEDLAANAHATALLEQRDLQTRRLREREAELAAVLDELPALVMTTNDQLRVTSIRGGVAGIASDGFSLGAPVSAILAFRENPAAEAAYARALAGEPSRADFDAAPHTVELHITPAREAGSEEVGGTITVAVDVTAGRAEQARQQHAQRLQSLGVLAGGIAHDFNNLLVAMLGHASLALQLLPADTAARRHVRRVETAARRASDLTRQLLAYSGTGSMVVESVNLVEVIREMRDLLKFTVPATVVMTMELDPVGRVLGDAAQLRQVIANLVTNAAESAAGGGSVVVRTRRTILSESRAVALGLQTCGAFACVEVIDDGVGMAPEVQARVFEPFFTTKGSGRGLGLAAVQGIVREHRGALRVESELGRGTTVRLYLREGGPDSARRSEPATPRSSGPGLSILVVEDDPEVLDCLVDALELLGHTVVAYADGEAAMAAADGGALDVDLAMLDLTLPGVSGLAVAAHLRAGKPALPLLLTSGYHAAETSEVLARLGRSSFLRKPWDLAQLKAGLGALTSLDDRHG